MNKTVAIVASVYVAGVVFELFALPSTTDKTQRALGWPYYFATGVYGYFNGTHTLATN